jgi:Rieske 2Fe-2S family protein
MRSLAAPVSSLPGQWYTSEAIFARERERIFDRSWLCVARSEDLAAPGDYLLLDQFGESVILVRGDDGTARAFYNVCRHRGARLCSTERGRFAGAIVCPYHAWTFALDGSLAAARTMAGVPDFERGDYPLYAVAVEEFAGFLFVNFETDAAARGSAATFLQPLADKIARWDIARLKRAQSVSYEVAANWKLIGQNYSECYHCPVVHPQLDVLSPWDGGSNDLLAGAIVGGPMRLREAFVTMSETGTGGRAPVGTVDGEDLRRVYYYSVFPSVLLSLHPDYVMVHRIQPLAAERSRVICEWLFAPEAVSAPGFDIRDVVDFWDLTNRQDWHVCEISQRGVASRAYTPGPYSGFESGLVAYDAHYRAVMGF